MWSSSEMCYLKKQTLWHQRAQSVRQSLLVLLGFIWIHIHVLAHSLLFYCYQWINAFPEHCWCVWLLLRRTLGQVCSVEQLRTQMTQSDHAHRQEGQTVHWCSLCYKFYAAWHGILKYFPHKWQTAGPRLLHLRAEGSLFLPDILEFESSYFTFFVFLNLWEVLSLAFCPSVLNFS